MAFVEVTGLWLPERLPNVATAFTTVQALAATGDKVAYCGRVWTPNRGSKNITTLGFRFGAVTKAGNSGLTVSLQDVDLANGPPIRPDGTQDQTVAVAAAAVTANTWINTGALNATRTVAHGDKLAVVVEFDGGGRLGADSFVIQGLTAAAAFNWLDTAAVGFTGATWTAVSGIYASVLLGYDDGTFGTLDDQVFASAAASDAFNNTSIIGVQFQVPFACKVDGAFAVMQAAANADYNLVLYSVSGSTLTALATSTFDANAQRAAATVACNETIFAEQTLTAGTTYFLGLVPQTANNVTLYNISVNSASHMGALWGGTTWQYNTASGTTLGAATATKRPMMGLRISAVDDGTGNALRQQSLMVGNLG